MTCPECGGQDSRVLDTRDVGEVVRRRRLCPCGEKFTTEEKVKRRPGTTTARGQPQLALGDDFTTGSNNDTLPVADSLVPLAVSSEIRDLSLLSESPDPSKPIRSEVGNMMSGKAAHKATLYHRALALFCRLWEERYGRPYRPTAGDRNQLGRALGTLQREDYPDVPVAFRNYLDDLTPWVAQDHRHNLTYFCTLPGSGFNKYRVTAPVLSKREAHSHEAGRQFLNGDGKHGTER